MNANSMVVLHSDDAKRWRREMEAGLGRRNRSWDYSEVRPNRDDWKSLVFLLIVNCMIATRRLRILPVDFPMMRQLVNRAGRVHRGADPGVMTPEVQLVIFHAISDKLLVVPADRAEPIRGHRQTAVAGRDPISSFMRQDI
jgi:hypothetical protein